MWLSMYVNFTYKANKKQNQYTKEQHFNRKTALFCILNK